MNSQQYTCYVWKQKGYITAPDDRDGTYTRDQSYGRRLTSNAWQGEGAGRVQCVHMLWRSFILPYFSRTVTNSLMCSSSSNLSIHVLGAK